MARAALWDDLIEHANPLPSQHEWVVGITHRSDQQSHRGQLWEPVRAIASNKVYRLRILEENMAAASGAPGLADPPQLRELVFTKAYPETRSAGGMLPMTEEGWRSLKKEVGIKTEAQWVRALFNLHDGEVRFVGNPGWVELPDPDNLFHPHLWHSQTMRTPRARDWAHFHHGQGQTDQRLKEAPLSQSDVDWVLAEEGRETRLMKFCPASGGDPSQWFIRQGNYVTLGELFTFGAYRCTCWDMYRTYRSLEVFIDRKPHSVSGSEEGTLRQNAKRKQFSEKGKWGLRR